MSNKITLAQVHTMLTSVVDEVIALKDRLSVVQQHIGGVDATINSTLGRMDAIESTVANVVAAIADMKPTEPFTQPVIEAQVIQPAHVLAQPVIENGKLAEVRVQRQLGVTALVDASDLARSRYDSGLASYIEILTADQDLFQQQILLAQVRGAELRARAELYRTLGGGWQP
jgi:hypothetical protein